MATNKPRYTVSVDEELFEQIEDFRYGYRYPTRADATVELLKLGLAAVKEEEKKHGGILRKREKV